MSKPTIFFSHSSKDKDMILTIRNKLDQYTGGVLDIFMSSDGQSIPFGANWVHKVEEGLERAKIMFVFVTDNSVKSGWLYFEAGFAYSKGIRVIPVGVGVDIGTIKAPLNLLQGFNVFSPGSLNNFISIVNATFDYHFSEEFNDLDYAEVMKNSSQAINCCVPIEEICECITYTIHNKSENQDGKTSFYNLNDYYDRITAFFDENEKQYRKRVYKNDEIPVFLKQMFNGFEERKVSLIDSKGIQVFYYQAWRKSPVSQEHLYEESQIEIFISPYNFESRFSVLLDLIKTERKDPMRYITFQFRDNIEFIKGSLDVSAVLSAYSDDYKADNERDWWYKCDSLGLSFSTNRLSSRFTEMDIGCNCNIVRASDIVLLMNQLFEAKLLSFKNDTNSK